jgi:hypothetical protein
MLSRRVTTARGAIMAEREATAKAQLKVRCPERLRARLEAEAALEGHSLNSEIVSRLEQSFEIQKAYGGRETQKVLRTLAGFTPDDEWVHSWFMRRAVYRDWQRRFFEESPSRLAEDLLYCREKQGKGPARELAISYYDLVAEKFSEKDQQEYCDWVKQIVGLSREDLIADRGND